MFSANGYFLMYSIPLAFKNGLTLITYQKTATDLWIEKWQGPKLMLLNKVQHLLFTIYDIH